ncbi:hypothetical protein FOZ62_008199 [Perkinsus olseni]|uniref:C3H1-type domain-containing protein n=1 Tax=Perkinsus olseni TaxID=32597 RepID=A0A7J6R831_PEROL|nr:hypothetical protein FOZ62_008199 [Perkinsus olseni]
MAKRSDTIEEEEGLGFEPRDRYFSSFSRFRSRFTSLLFVVTMGDTPAPQKIFTNARDAWHNRYLNQFYKTEMCKFMLNGSCSKGATCSHAHTKEELREKPDLSKTRMCRALLQKGACSNHRRCPYAHDIRQVRSTNAFFKTKMCSFYESGFCKLGNKCRYAHGESELIPDDWPSGDDVGVAEHPYVRDPSSSKASSASTTPSDLDHDCKISSRSTPTVGRRSNSETPAFLTEDIEDIHGESTELGDYQEFSTTRQPGLPNYPGYHLMYYVNAPGLCTGAAPPFYSAIPVPGGPLPAAPSLYGDVSSDRTVIAPVPVPYILPYGMVPVAQAYGPYAGPEMMHPGSPPV